MAYPVDDDALYIPNRFQLPQDRAHNAAHMQKIREWHAKFPQAMKIGNKHKPFKDGSFMYPSENNGSRVCQTGLNTLINGLPANNFEFDSKSPSNLIYALTKRHLSCDVMTEQVFMARYRIYAEEFYDDLIRRFKAEFDPRQNFFKYLTHN